MKKNEIEENYLNYATIIKYVFYLLVCFSSDKIGNHA